MTPLALFALALAAMFAYSAWCDHRDARAERARAARDLAAIEEHRAALTRLHRRIDAARRAHTAGHPCADLQLRWAPAVHVVQAAERIVREADQ